MGYAIRENGNNDAANGKQAADLHAALDHVDELPGGFPDISEVAPISQEEGLGIAKSFEHDIRQLLAQPSADLIEQLFHPEAFWRDQVSLTWSIRTFHPSSLISSRLPDLLQRAKVKSDSIVLLEDQVAAVPLPNHFVLLRVPFTFETSNPPAKCTVAFKFIKLRSGDIKILTVTSALQEITAKPWVDFDSAPAESSGAPQPTAESLPAQVECLIVGGGSAGLGLAAYLKKLGIEYALIDREASVGDSWDKRYKSATLHTIKHFSGLPYVPFPKHYPLYVPANLIAEYYRDYVRKLKLPVFPGREACKADWDDSAKVWTVTVRKGDATETIRTKTIVLAVGIGGRFPVMPDVPNRQMFQGNIMHAADYTEPSGWQGKKVVIVGASTTGIDIAFDCSRLGIDVTMIQRGPTRVYPEHHIGKVKEPFWNEKGQTELGDVLSTEDPVALGKTLVETALKNLSDAHDQAYYDGLRKAGFKVTRDGPLHQQIFVRCGGHYPDVGACQAIIDGDIKVKSDASIQEFTESGIAFSDGTHIQADVVCFATGYEKDLRMQLAPILGEDIATRLNPIWGINREGEVRGVWVPQSQDNIWIHGGDLQTMRYYGKFLALQVAAETAGVRPLPVQD